MSKGNFEKAIDKVIAESKAPEDLTSEAGAHKPAPDYHDDTFMCPSCGWKSRERGKCSTCLAEDSRPTDPYSY